MDLKECILSFDPSKDEYFTEDDQLRVDEVSKRFGREVTRADIVEACPEYHRGYEEPSGEAESDSDLEGLEGLAGEPGGVQDEAEERDPDAERLQEQMLSGDDLPAEEPDAPEEQRDRIEEIDKEVSAIRQEMQRAEDHIAGLNEERRLLSLRLSPEYNHKTDQARRAEFIKSQAEQRKKRFAGVGPKPGASPLDQAMNVRKGSGRGRPAPRLLPAAE